MSLYLYELVPAEGQADAAIKAFDGAVVAAGGELIESQVTTGGTRVFAIAEFNECRAAQLEAASLDVAEIVGPNEVRLVGADLDDIKSARPAAGYLVEWANFDNNTRAESPIGESRAPAERSPAPAALPATVGSFVRVRISEDAAADHKPVDAFFRRNQNGWALVGIDRGISTTTALKEKTS
jgi:hypothetical protein